MMLTLGNLAHGVYWGLLQPKPDADSPGHLVAALPLGVSEMRKMKTPVNCQVWGFPKIHPVKFAGLE
jgi:hypothetical protein